MAATATKVVLVVAVSLLAASAATRGVEAKTARVGYLSSNPPSDTQSAVDAFRLRLRDLGYVEGQTLLMEYRYAQGTFGPSAV